MKLCGKTLHDLDDAAIAYIIPSSGKRICRPCKRERTRKRRAADPARARAYAREWYAANPERERRRSREWIAANQERVATNARARRMANPERFRENFRAWCAANPERVRVRANTSAARRHARIAHILITLTPQEWDAILEAAGYACSYCGSIEQISMDHLIPIARGGDHTAANVVPACLPCNQSKGAKAVAEFLQERSHVRA